MQELKEAYKGIDSNPMLDPRPNVLDQILNKPNKPNVTQLQNSHPISKTNENEFLHVKPKHPYCGLENYHFVCYSNSVIQVLYTCTRIRQYILEHGQSGPMHALLSNLFAVMIKECTNKMSFDKKIFTTPHVNPESMFNCPFRAVRKEFARNQMHDAQEYLTILLELIHQEVNAANANRDRRPKEAPTFQTAEEQWTYHRTYVDDSALSKLFMGQIESMLTCLTCGHKSRSWTAIWQLQIHLESEEKDQTIVKSENNKVLSLAECIKEEFATVEVSCLLGIALIKF